jgi:hypothetical protein
LKKRTKEEVTAQIMEMAEKGPVSQTEIVAAGLANQVLNHWGGTPAMREALGLDSSKIGRWAGHTPVTAISKTTGRPYHDQYKERKKQETSKATAQLPVVQRVCLKCARMFKARGKFNRLCGQCNTTNSDSYGALAEGRPI